MILQRLPASHYGSEHPDLLEAREEGWRRATILMAILTDDELSSRDISPADLIHRLFHEEEVTLHQPSALEDRCRCSCERLASVLSFLGADDIAEMTLPDDHVLAVCQFCSRRYDFSPDSVQRFTKQDVGAGTQRLWTAIWPR